MDLLASDQDDQKKKRKRKKHVPQRTVYSEAARQERLQFLEESTGTDLDSLKSIRLDPQSVRGNVEAIIGAVEVPMGAAGPLLIHGSFGTDEVYAPLATTEGALVSSVARGSHAISVSGGVTVRSLGQKMVRAPFFDCGSIEGCLWLQNWMENNLGQIKRKAREFSNYAELVNLDFNIIAPCLHVRFEYKTGDASGQNMVTVCTWGISQWIIDKIKKEKPGMLRSFNIEGNLTTDKKGSNISIMKGRGHHVVAEAFLKESVIRRVFHSSSEQMLKLFRNVQATGLITGQPGFNSNVANIVAALFTATGQDIACVNESSHAQLFLEARDGGMYASLLMPTIIAGTVGGGTGLPVQKQCLQLMGCQGVGQSSRFAETLCAFALALELSTGAAIAAGHFVSAHESLGRNKSQNWLKKEELTHTFFNYILQGYNKAQASVLEVEEVCTDSMGESLVMDLSSQVSQRLCGLWVYDFIQAGEPEAKRVFVKSKVSDKELIFATEIMAGLSSPGLAGLLNESKNDSLFQQSHIRELKIATLDNAILEKIRPKTFGILMNQDRQVFLQVQEFLSDVELLDAVEQRLLWSKSHIESAIVGIGEVHRAFFSEAENLKSQRWMFTMNPGRAQRLEQVQLEFARKLLNDSPDWFTEADLDFHKRYLSGGKELWERAAIFRHTLIHNDFNPRNIAFRKATDGSVGSLVAYDWELATIGLPQRDIVELLAFTMEKSQGHQLFFEYIKKHAQVTYGEEQSWVEILEQTRLALYDFILYRLPMYAVAQTFKNLPFLEPTYKMARVLLNWIEQGEE